MRRWTQITAVVVLLWGSAPLFTQEQDRDPSSAPANNDGAKVPRKASRTRWGADYFPNVPLVTHEGKSVRFFDDLIENKVVVINFFFANCADACPLGTAQLAKVHQLLGDRMGRDIFMYSISIDPERDTPEVLSRYVEKFRIGPGWLFLTGKEADVLLLRKKLGMYLAGLDEELKDHSMSLIMGNQRTGQWMKRSPMDNPYFLAEQIGSWLTNWAAPSPHSDNNYANAPELRVPSMGENLFRTRCVACHTIGAGSIRIVGGGERSDASLLETGPDLLHVTQTRDRAWLARLLANPAKMLAEKDPVFLWLYSEYDEVLMPNLRLNDTEVSALIQYMDEESRRVEQTAPVAAAAVPVSEHHQH